jgi:tellurite resistance protein
VLFCAAGCDGPIAREEQEELLALVHRSRALKTLSEEALYRMIESVMERMRIGGDRALAEACAALLPEMRASAFAHALDIALSDGDLSEDESNFLNVLVSHLGLDEKTVRGIADVIILKNKY